jgi:hypothetical protein
LRVEQARQEHNVLKDLCERAARRPDYSEWWNGLNELQRRLVRKIKPLLANKSLRHTELQREVEGGGDEAALQEAERLSLHKLIDFLGHVDVETLSLREIENRAEATMPQSNVSPATPPAHFPTSHLCNTEPKPKIVAETPAC